MDRRQQVKNAELRLALEAGREWEAQQPRINAVLQSLKAKGPSGTDTQARVGMFLTRELHRSRALNFVRFDPPALGLERRFGPTLDYDYIPPPEAQAVSSSVGRLVEGDGITDVVSGFATGFLVSPRLLMTNWHVFEEADWAEGTSVQFGYEYRGALIQAGSTFRLRPDDYFISDKTLDYALVAVEPTNARREVLSAFGMSRLIPSQGKILVGHAVNMIGHPGGMPKTYVYRNNPLVSVEPTTVLYLTDSDEGASGSPAYNPVWELIALHHRAVPKTENGRVLLKNNRGYWERGMSIEDIEWLGNQGVRVSVIVDHLRRQQRASPHPLLADLLSRATDPITTEAGVDLGREGARMSDPLLPPTSVISQVPTTAAPVQMLFSGPVTIHVAAPAAQSMSAITRSDAVSSPESSPGQEARIRFDADYDNRPGYDAEFLGVSVSPPRTSAARMPEMLKEGGRELVLPYHNFSLAMNKERRLQMWSAVNVDYSEKARRWFGGRDSFGSDKWIPDPRIPAKYQIMDPEAYEPSKSLQRGHMVRRDDAAWGTSRKTQEYGNSDTFHWTNCTPQHGGFNQSHHPQGKGNPSYPGIWGGLENKISEISRQADNSRLVIFSGPVLDPDDDEWTWGVGYIKIPMKFWKIVIAIESGQLHAYGFVLDQTKAFKDLGFERLRFDMFEDYTMAIEEIATMTGVEFPAEVAAADSNTGG